MRQEWSQAHRIQPKGGVKNVITKTNSDSVESYLVPGADCYIYLHRSNRVHFTKCCSKQNFRVSVGGFSSRLPCANVVGNLHSTGYAVAGANTDAVRGSLGFVCVQPNVGSIEIYASAGGAYQGRKQLLEKNLDYQSLSKIC